jgi:hypothetical protein
VRVRGSDHGTASTGWRGEGVGRRVREDARRRAWDGGPVALEVVAGGGVPAVGVAGRWVEVRDDLLFSFFHFLFFIGLTSGSLSMSAHIEQA